MSLFLVPKFLVERRRSLGARNDVFCAAARAQARHPRLADLHHDLRRRLRQGGAPGAIGWLVGEENRGLACMFTMMNNARLAVGMQGVAVAEAATQKAIAYANERRQGKAAGYARRRAWRRSSITPTSQRMLLTMKALTQRRPRHLLCLRPCHRHGACARRRRRTPLAGARQSADADRQGLLPPMSASRSPRSACRCMAAWASSRRPARRGSIAMPASRRSTKAPTASRRSIW